MASGYSKRHETRRIHFNINSGLVELIGRASVKDKSREASAHNLYFQEKSLSKRHAVLNVKKFGSIEGYEEDDYDKIYENIRIYVEDLDSTHGIVDLQSNIKEMSNIIDLKNGERFGVVFMPHPMTCQQTRGARLKFQVNVAPLHGDIWELVVKDVTYDDSPCTTKGGAVEEYGRSSMHALADSCSDWNGSEAWYDENIYGTLGDSTDSSKLTGGGNSILESNYDFLLDNEGTEENNTCRLPGGKNMERLNGHLGTSITSIEKEGLEIVDSFMENDDSYELLASKTANGKNTVPSIWKKKPILVSTFVGSVVGFVVGFIVGAATLE